MNTADPRACPRVSIVMPSHNRADLLPRAARGVLAQTYASLELLIVNDGSTDHTAAVADELAASDPRVRVIHKRNGGIADAINVGMAAARGDYVTWNSDDNVYHPDAIALMAGYLDAHPEVDFVYTDAREVDAEGRLIQLYKGGPPETLLRRCNIRGCLLYRRRVNEVVGPYDPRWIRVQDYDFYRRAYRAGVPMAYLPEAPYDYTVHAQSMSGNETALLRETGEMLACCAAGRREKRAVWARIHALIAKAERDRRGRPWRAVRHWLCAGRHDPSMLPHAWHELWTTAYGALPESVRRGWRWLRQRQGRL